MTQPPASSSVLQEISELLEKIEPKIHGFRAAGDLRFHASWLDVEELCKKLRHAQAEIEGLQRFRESILSQLKTRDEGWQKKLEAAEARAEAAEGLNRELRQALTQGSKGMGLCSNTCARLLAREGTTQLASP